jgi:Glucosyl transferase GtrII
MGFFNFKDRLKNFYKVPSFICFCVIFAASIIIFQIYLGAHFSNDCYHLWFEIEDFPYQASSQGRPLTGLIAAFFNNLGVNLVRQQQIFTFIGLLIYSIAITCLLETILKLKNDYSVKFRVISGLISLMIVFNFFSVDMFHYSVMMLSYSFSALLTVLASRSILLKQNFFSLVKAVLFLVTAAMFYQSYITLFVPLVLIGLLLNSESSLDLRRKLSWCLLSLAGYGAVLVIDYAYIKLIHLKFLNHLWFDARTGQPSPVLNNLRYIYHIQNDLWINSFGLMNRYYFLILICAFVCLFVFYHSKIKEKISVLFFLGLSLTMFYAVLLIPHIFSGDIGVSARSISTFASIPALILFGFIIYQRHWFEKLNLKNIGLFLPVGLFLILQITVINTFGTEGVNINKQDSLEARQIVDLIEGYENKSGNKVTDLYFKNDSSPMRCFRPDCYVHAKALAVPWSRIESVKLYTGRSFNAFEMNAEDFARLFEDKNWDEFVPPEQIKFEGNKGYIVVF